MISDDRWMDGWTDGWKNTFTNSTEAGKHFQRYVIRKINEEKEKKNNGKRPKAQICSNIFVIASTPISAPDN